MKVFRTSLFVADVEKTLLRRRVRIGRTNYVLRTPGLKKASGELSYGPKVGRPLDVTSEYDVLWTTLAEWDSIISVDAWITIVSTWQQCNVIMRLESYGMPILLIL